MVAGLGSVIRLNTGIAPSLVHEEGQKVVLTLTPGKKVYYRNLPYNGEVKVNVAGWWRQGLNEPLGVVPNLEPQATLSIYQRMKIEESLRHLMSLWGLGKVMDKRRDCREKVTALVMLAYSLGTPGRRSAKRPGLRGKGAGGFFGLFLLLKKARQVSMEIVREAARRVTPPLQQRFFLLVPSHD